MTKPKQLPPVRVVQDGEEAPDASMQGAVRSGNRLDELRAMRRVLAAHIDSENTLARDLAPLMRQAREISKEIEELEAAEAVLTEGVAADDSGGTSEDRPFRLEAI